MPIITILPPHEAQKIAAGEVVERPLHIVKELVENALDANATSISIYLKDGGRSYIRVVDNGIGMDDQDAVQCFQRHATSKISKFDDLITNTTFGFRGEALASIAAISNVTMITKQKNASYGLKIEVSGGVISPLSPTSCTTGTDIHIADIFYNVPVRKKFLRQKETELRSIVHYVQSVCLSNHMLEIKLFHEGQPIIHCPSVKTVSERFVQLWSLYNAINIEHKKEPVKVTCTGTILPAEYNRYDKNNIFIVVNKRIIKDYKISNAVIKGYNNSLPQGKYPYAYVNIDIDPTLVDINVHPRKEEVLFAHPRLIEQCVEMAVTQGLEQKQSEHLKKSMAHDQVAQWEPVTPLFDNNSQAASSIPITGKASAIEKTYQYQIDNSTQRTKTIITPQPTTILPTIEPLATHLPNNHHHVKQESLPFNPQKAIHVPYRIIGFYKKTYILLEHEDGLLLVDIHAAHERILYEQFFDEFSTLTSIKLAFPHSIFINKDEMKIIIPHLGVFEKNGIEISPVSPTQLLINAAPKHFQNIAFDELIKTAIATIQEHEHLDNKTLFTTLNEKLRSQMACKAAIKAGDHLETSEMIQLINDLYTTNNRFCCPHGRPTTFLLPLIDIEKKFKRKK